MTSKLQGQQTSGASSVSQQAALAALEGPKDFIRESRVAFQSRRDLMVTLLNDTPGLECISPAGAFYAFASCAGLIGRTSAGGRVLHSDEDVAHALLDEEDVAVVHGSAFGLGPYIHIAYALDDASLRRACEAIHTFFVFPSHNAWLSPLPGRPRIHLPAIQNGHISKTKTVVVVRFQHSQNGENTKAALLGR